MNVSMRRSFTSSDPVELYELTAYPFPNRRHQDVEEETSRVSTNESIFANDQDSPSSYDSFLASDKEQHAILQAAKAMCGQLGDRYKKIRGRFNPFESLGRGPQDMFINRSAMKLANMNRLCLLLLRRE